MKKKDKKRSMEYWEKRGDLPMDIIWCSGWPEPKKKKGKKKRERHS